MQRIGFILVFLFTAFTGFGQEISPVSWHAKTKWIDKNTLEVELHASIDDKWHLYSQNLPSDEGPIATSFHWNLPEGAALSGNTAEPAPIEAYDNNFMMNVRYFSKEVVFTQRITFSGSMQDAPLVTANYMVCDDEMCLPPKDVAISISLP